MVGHSSQPSGPGGGGQAAFGQAGGERVAKAMARAGVASRREIERLIEAGRVALNGAVLTTPAVKVGAGDILTVDGAVVGTAEPARLFRYHKPVGLVTTHRDPKDRPTVFQALPPGLPRLISVGRLDITSEGLLLLTNDGGLARALELPSNGWPRRYRARARGRIDQARLDRLKDGITVEGVRYGAIQASLDPAREGPGPAPANLWITLTLAEGKNREVRRILEALGLTVNRLIRVAYGPFDLGTLGSGAVEEVGPPAIRQHLGPLIDPAYLPKGDKVQFKAVAGEPGRRREPVRKALVTGGERDAAPARKTYQPGWAKPKPRLKTSAPRAAGKSRKGGPPKARV